MPTQVDATAQNSIGVGDLLSILNVSATTFWSAVKDGRFPIEPITTTKPQLWSRKEVTSWVEHNTLKRPKYKRCSNRKIEGSKIECLGCGQMLEKEMFHTRKGAPLGLNSQCVSCRSVYLNRHFNDKTCAERRTLIENARQRKQMARNKPGIIRARRIWHAAKRRANKKTITFSIQLERVLNSILKGECEKTGLPFDFSKPRGGWSNPFCPSIDRIDTQKGYTCDNVQVVAGMYNQGKCDANEIDFIAMCVAVAEKHADDPAVIQRLKELRNAEF